MRIQELIARGRSFRTLGPALLLGISTAWILKDLLAPLILGGRPFSGRSLGVQAGTLLLSSLVFTALWLAGLLAAATFRRPMAARSEASSNGRRWWGRAQTLEAAVQAVGTILEAQLRQNGALLAALGSLAVAAYGFELFNLNLTLDDELWAFGFLGPSDAISQGRWAMYVLNPLLIPYPIIPFVPLAVALIFHILAAVILVRAWGPSTRFEEFVAGAIAITFPSLAFIYHLAALNYGIGIGFLAIAVSLVVFQRGSGWKKFWAFVPATLAIGIYQQLFLALAAVYLVHFLSVGMRGRQVPLDELLAAAGVHALALAASSIIGLAFQAVSGIPESEYISQIVDARLHWGDLQQNLARLGDTLISAYSGRGELFTSQMGILGWLMAAALIAFTANLWRTGQSLLRKIGLMSLLGLLLLLPFASGALVNWFWGTRWLLGLPIAIAGLTMLALHENRDLHRWVVSILALMTIFRSIQSVNHLFASAHISLQADRVLAARLTERMDRAIYEASAVSDVRYLEIVGLLERAATPLTPKRDWTFGYSFFEIDEGNSSRALAFLKTLGYEGLGQPPPERRMELIEVAQSMPVWPMQGSVRLADDTVLVRFGDYSFNQRHKMCLALSDETRREYDGFCSHQVEP